MKYGKMQIFGANNFFRKNVQEVLFQNSVVYFKAGKKSLTFFRFSLTTTSGKIAR